MITRPAALQISSECATQLSGACSELSQLIRLLGTMKIDLDSDLAVRGIAVRMAQLHDVVFAAIIGPISASEISETVKGPGQWFDRT